MCGINVNRNDDKWFCSKKCEKEWKILNGELRKENNFRVRGRDTSG
jgi:hypothetical protein